MWVLVTLLSVRGVMYLWVLFGNLNMLRLGNTMNRSNILNGRVCLDVLHVLWVKGGYSAWTVRYVLYRQELRSFLGEFLEGSRIVLGANIRLISFAQTLDSIRANKKFVIPSEYKYK